MVTSTASAVKMCAGWTEDGAKCRRRNGLVGRWCPLHQETGHTRPKRPPILAPAALPTPPDARNAEGWGPWEIKAGPRRTSVVTVDGRQHIQTEMPADPLLAPLATEPRRFAAAEYPVVLKLVREHQHGYSEVCYVARGVRYGCCLGHEVTNEVGGRLQVYDLYPTRGAAQQVLAAREQRRREQQRRETATRPPTDVSQAITYGMESGAYQRGAAGEDEPNAGAAFDDFDRLPVSPSPVMGAAEVATFADQTFMGDNPAAAPFL